MRTQIHQEMMALYRMADLYQKEGFVPLSAIVEGDPLLHLPILAKERECN
jgi:hypothetical protein